jgi:hypothetical protein
MLMFYDFVSSQLFRENVSHGRKADIEQKGTDQVNGTEPSREKRNECVWSSFGSRDERTSCMAIACGVP